MISPEAPYPMDGGGSLRTASLLGYLASRYEVDLVVFQHPGQATERELPAGLVKRYFPIPLRFHQRNAPSRVYRNARRLLVNRPPLLDRFMGYEKAIESALDSSRYDLAVLEHFWTATYLSLARRHAERTALDLHNVDSAWHATCAQAPGWGRRLAHRQFARSAARLEGKFLPKCDWTLTASAEDAERVRNIAPHTRVSVYPNAFPWRDRVTGDGEFALAFSGNLEYEPNRTGLNYFLTQIWPVLRARHSGLEFRVIGRNAESIPEAMRRIEGVRYSGAVPDTFPYLAKARVCVAPLISGSGTRLKIIEAWAVGRPVVSTRIGAEGLGAVDGQSILLAEAPKEFADRVSQLLDNEDLRQKIANGGRDLYERNFTWEQAWKTLHDLF